MWSLVPQWMAVIGFLVPGCAKLLLFMEGDEFASWVVLGVFEAWLGVGLLLRDARLAASLGGITFCALASVYGWLMQNDGGCLCLGRWGELGRSSRIVYMGSLGILCAWIAMQEIAITAVSAAYESNVSGSGR